MRRLTSLAAAAALLALLLPANVAAATRTTEQSASLGCGTQSDEGTLSLFAQASDLFGDFTEVLYWGPGVDPTFEAPTLVGFGEDVTATETSIDMSVEMFEEATGDPAGTATVEAALVAIGEPEPINETIRNGNRWERITGTVTTYDVTGTAAIDGVGAFDLAMACFADSATLVRVFNQPASHVFRFEETYAVCSWEVGSAFVTLSLFFDSFGGGAEFFIFAEDGEVGGFGDLAMDAGAFSATIDIFDFMSEQPVGTAAAEGTMAVVGGRSRSTESDGLSNRKVVSRALAVEGSLSVEIDGATTELEMSPEACFGEERSVRSKFVGPKGPKATVMANDTPDGAIALNRLPARVLTNTGLTAPMPEVPCLIEQDGELVELPIGSTAWWTFTGTGRNVTVDTARSSFDTALAIYWWDGSEFVPLACVDDVFDEESFSLLASATIPTERGETYHVQVGGYAGNTGRLQFTVR